MKTDAIVGRVLPALRSGSWKYTPTPGAVQKNDVEVKRYPANPAKAPSKKKAP